MAENLTAIRIRDAEVRPREYEIGDAKAPGLYLVVRPSGGKSWVFRYRSPRTKLPGKVTIGPLATYPLADARKKATDALRKIHELLDPAREKKAAKIAAVRDAAEEKDRDVCALLDGFYEKHVSKKRASTQAEMKRHIENRIKPAWKGRTIDSIEKRDIIALLDRTEKDGPILANRVLATVRKFFNFQVGRAVIDISPAAGIEAPADETPRDRRLSADEIRLLWTATDSDASFPIMLRVLLLTGQRRSEVAGMRWSEISDLTGPNPTWTIPKERTKNGREHKVPLAEQVVKLLPAKIDDCDFVFPSATLASPVASFSKPKKTVDAAMLKETKRRAEKRGENPKKIELQPWRLHDLRRTAATEMAEIGIAPHIVEAILNHVSGHKAGVAGTYNRAMYEPEKRTALAALARHVEALVNGQDATNVVALVRA